MPHGIGAGVRALVERLFRDVSFVGVTLASVRESLATLMWRCGDQYRRGASADFLSLDLQRHVMALLTTVGYIPHKFKVRVGRTDHGFSIRGENALVFPMVNVNDDDDDDDDGAMMEGVAQLGPVEATPPARSEEEEFYYSLSPEKLVFFLGVTVMFCRAGSGRFHVVVKPLEGTGRP